MKILPVTYNCINQIKNNNFQQNNINYMNKDSFVSSSPSFSSSFSSALSDIKNQMWLKKQPELWGLFDERNEICNKIKEVRDGLLKNNDYELGLCSFSSAYSSFLDIKPKPNMRPFYYASDYVYKNSRTDYLMTRNDAVVENCRAVFSKDKNLAEKFMDALTYYTKAHCLAVTPLDLDNKSVSESLINFNRVNFEKLSDNFEDTDSFQDALLEKMESAKKLYQETKRPTVLRVENMERLLSKENSHGNIACMKDLMSNCWEDYNTVFLFSVSDKANCDEGTLVSHRIGIKYNLDEYNITHRDVDDLFIGRKKLEPAIEKLCPLYTKYLELTDKINSLCSSRIDEATKAYEGIQKKQSETLEPTIKKLCKNKKVMVAFGALAALGTAAAVLYKKSKGKKTKQQNQVASQSINKVGVEPNKTQVAQPIKNSYNSSATTKKSSVFDEFQKVK